MIHVVVSFVSYGKWFRVFELGCFIMGNLENNLNIEFDSSFGPSLDLVLETQIDNSIHNKSQD
jgi:hypothetical protein